MDHSGVDYLIAIHVFCSVGRHINASGTGDGTSLDIIIDIEVGIELNLLFADELCQCGGYNGQDVTVADKLLSGSLAGVGQLIDLVLDAEGMVDESGDAQLVGQVLAHTDLGGIGIQDDHVGR